ncbi:3'-5' exonuclease [Pseudomonas sp. RIT-PI-AD]|uniref:3'-5' exonuclease n=1 Tax=Pseudomonas sp. RIT-PI-AD TaxID=3035294 RepID=UPI0021DB2FE4|nr:3'-5' exonuclease [Pseudomonas sp. RIT-PI-AD]
MTRFPWRWRRRPPLDPALQTRRERLPEPAAFAAANQRLVVLDLETSGLDLQRDHLLSIGAVVIEEGAIDFAQQFETTLRREHGKPGASVLLHGLAPSALAAGVEPAEGLLAFMEFLGDSPLLAFHAGFDRHMLARALKDDLDLRLQHPFLDIAELAPLLCPEAGLERGGLDDWVAHFDLYVPQRHHASADALVTAEIALILFSRARRRGFEDLPALVEACARRRRRQQTPSF